MPKDFEFAFGVICKSAVVDAKSGLVSLQQVLPVIVVDARCKGAPKEDMLAIKLDSLILVLVFRRKKGVAGKISSSVHGALYSDEKLLAKGLTLDVVMDAEADSVNQLIDLEGAIVPSPSAEGVHEVVFSIKLDVSDEPIGVVDTILKIIVSHSIDGLP